MDGLVQRNFPISSLHDTVLSPVNVLASNMDEERDAVLTIQCNRLRGGLAINIVGNHQVLGGTGQEQLVYLLDKAGRREAFGAEEIAIANLDKRTVIQPFDSDWQAPLDTMYIKPPYPTPMIEDLGARCTRPAVERVNLAFSKIALTRLKAVAMAQSWNEFVSIDDVLTAFVWQALARARINRV